MNPSNVTRDSRDSSRLSVGFPRIELFSRIVNISHFSLVSFSFFFSSDYFDFFHLYIPHFINLYKYDFQHI